MKRADAVKQIVKMQKENRTGATHEALKKLAEFARKMQAAGVLKYPGLLGIGTVRWQVPGTHGGKKVSIEESAYVRVHLETGVAVLSIQRWTGYTGTYSRGWYPHYKGRQVVMFEDLDAACTELDEIVADATDAGLAAE